MSKKDNNKKIHHVRSNDNKIFSFRNPIVYRNSESHFLVISTNLSNTCPQASKEINLEVLKSSTKYDLIPENVESLKTNIYAINDIGFEGIIIRDRYSALYAIQLKMIVSFMKMNCLDKMLIIWSKVILMEMDMKILPLHGHFSLIQLRLIKKFMLL